MTKACVAISEHLHSAQQGDERIDKQAEPRQLVRGSKQHPWLAVTAKENRHGIHIKAYSGSIQDMLCWEAALLLCRAL